MTLAYLILALLLILALVYALLPFRGRPLPFPANPRPEELRAELEVLRTQAKEAQGEERKRLLAQMVRLERQLGEMGQENPAPRRPNPLVLGGAVGGLLLLGMGLWAYTVPRLPGETLVTNRSEAQILGRLQRQAEASGQAADWLAFANKAYELQDFERALRGYLRVVEKEPRNPVAVRRLGILLFMSGRPAEGAQALQLAVQADPHEPEGWLFLGNAYFQMGRYAEAISAWEGYLKAGGEARERVENLIETAKSQLGAGSTGQQVYLSRCAACHGAEAQGGLGPRLKGNPVLRVPEAVREVVQKGRGQMPAIPLSEAEMTALLQYLSGL
ncbi:MAG: tetratricopeptide repeat protein [Meiothermus sp.]|uniref:c-type cytochrome n=1 Tax=Meiothermus sp. TaxID=1955249 RepID=UPI00260C17C9|nr:c-type cytochrome [Meiothermus sp.]MCS7058597.1 tetratricopeptide repeat protein [Meiothermus sp.]MCX7739661.1 tetratricopeptide repeat protein [Meiothermus sp.]MDW8481946.1 tetratricopeptide repeat protein [Meiothermus sp.]